MTQDVTKKKVEKGNKHRRIRVLLIEDDEDDYLLTREFFDEFTDVGRHRLKWVSNFDEGHRALCSDDYDICLLDYRLGARDGVELLRSAREEDCRTPVIMLTGTGSHDVARTAMRLGASDYLVKGEITATLLERSIRHSLERHRFVEEQRVLAAENARLYEEAQRALEMRDEIYRIVVHDLRNPLSTMGLALQLMERLAKSDASGEAFTPQLETQRLCISQMKRLIQDLLDTARLEDGRLVLDRGLHLPGSIVDSVIAQHKIQADDRSVELVGHADDDLPRLDGDARRIEQVLANLIGNALKFTPEDGRIEVSAGHEDGAIHFTVTDTGYGIPAEQLPHLFDRFWQGNDGDRNGAGLGLAICKGLVEAHGGKIWAESTEGEGTTFSFTIPVGG